MLNKKVFAVILLALATQATAIPLSQRDISIQGLDGGIEIGESVVSCPYFLFLAFGSRGA